MTSERFVRQRSVVSEEEQERLRGSTVAVVGCGGLGNHVVMGLTSIGVGGFILVDGDLASESDLNRQFLSFGHLGQYKADVLGEWILRTDPSMRVEKYRRMIDDDCCDGIIGRADVVVDCLDNNDSRRVLARSCRRTGRILVHGGVEDSFGQAGVFMPDSRIHLESLLPDAEGEHPSYSPAVSIIGALEADEAVKVVLGRDDVLFDSLLFFDLHAHSMEIRRFGRDDRRKSIRLPGPYPVSSVDRSSIAFF